MATLATKLPRAASTTPWRRLILAIAVMLAIAAYFWTQSRYPALNAKAEMGGDTPISGISFDTLIEILPNDGVLWDIVGNTINWAFTNWKGMTFGFLFGAAALTLLSQIRWRSFRHPIANASMGAVIGAPLGVCVNCAVPIARGLHTAGLRLETTLAAMIASPTLNVIVVSMSFALLPTYMAVTKLAAMIAFIMLGVPLVVRLAGPDRLSEAGIDEVARETIDTPRRGLFDRLDAIRPTDRAAPASEGWAGAAAWLVESFVRNLAFIIAATLPLMLLAGALGAIVVSLLPFDTITEYLDVSNSVSFKLTALIVIALVCIFLPVPMSFDVILAAILISSGWPALLVMPVLVCLGSFSIYSYLVIARAVSLRLATALMFSLALVGAVSSIAAWRFDKMVREEASSDDRRFLMTAARVFGPAVEPSHHTAAFTAAPPPLIERQPLSLPLVQTGAGSVSISAAVLAGPSEPRGETPFARLPGSAIGLDLAPNLNGLEVVEPYTMFWAAASGDMNGDGWSDVALARPPAEGGIAFYQNSGGRFTPSNLSLGPVDGRFVNATAMVDFDNDGAADLFVSTYLHGAYVFWNRGGYSAAHMARLPNADAPMIGAPAFADLDDDGDVDILAANWSIGTIGNKHLPFLMTSRDRILWNEGGRFEPQLLDGLPGESLTSLITDVNGDGRPDLLIGDDVSTSDKIYINQGSRRFQLLRKSDGLVPYLTNTTMSFDAGDIDNDGKDELYAVQIAFKHKREQFDADTTYCADELSGQQKAACFRTVRDRSQAYISAKHDYSECASVEGERFRAICAVISVIRRAGYNNDPGQCAAIPAKWADLRRQCLLAAGARVPRAEETMRSSDYLGGIRGRNVLLQQTDAGGAFIDRTAALGVGQPGWAWNSKFVDLDQDGWQDILVASGFLLHRNYLPMTYYRNLGGSGFEAVSRKYGFEDEFPSSSYLSLDFDRDGDIDVIRPSATSQPIVHRNDRPGGGALWIRLDDRLGNRDGVGAIVRVRTASGTQTREVRQSGGFVSADQPVAHFGLGAAARVKAVTIIWPGGARTEINGSIAPNTELLITRN